MKNFTEKKPFRERKEDRKVREFYRVIVREKRLMNTPSKQLSSITREI